MQDTPVKFDRVGLHAVFDLMIDEAQKELDASGGHGISIQQAGNALVSVILIGGDHQRFTPKILGSAATEFIEVIASTMANVREAEKMPQKEVMRRMAEKLAPKTPNPN